MAENPTMVQFGSKMTEAIRVKRPPESTAVPLVLPTVPPPAPVVAANPQADAELNDEIPWK